ncbi:DUF1616 domain-containing protein [Halocatena pleomorpha]|uniref:DUF1616 domain-containing protein n=1 Tax=Halocatena pleomorpha TaxID=1785090 RepID=A0A3P3RC59_9EURY|nr:DUF1616 domain-containing protein [Halocatena pleomorpha]RRJ30559.1 DUF1616 domain-containing protein [Halocatena pleomorpha]
MVRWLLDLVAVALLSAVAGVALFTLDGPARTALVYPLLVFLPGYAFLSALFPEESELSRSRRGRQPWGSQTRRAQQGSETDFLLGNIERLVLSIALSLAIVAFVVFALNFTVGFDTRRIAVMLFGFTGSMVIFAVARRIVLPPEERFTIEITTEGIPMDASFLGLFGFSLLILAASTAGFVFLDPVQSSNSGLLVVAQNESTGDLSAQAAETAVMEDRPVTAVIWNNGSATQEYTVVVTHDGEVINETTRTIDAGAEGRIRYTPPSDGNQLTFYMYEGTAPDQHSLNSTEYFTRFQLSSSDGEEQESLAQPAVFDSAAALGSS